MHSYPYRSTRKGTSLDPDIAQREPIPLYSWAQLIAGGIALLLGLTSLILAVVYFKLHEGGFGLSRDVRFNLHPLANIIAIPFLLTMGILAWRLLPVSHRARKLTHVAFNIAAATFIAFALWIIFTTKTTDHVVTVHSWFGLATAALIGIQLLFGLLTYLFPVLPLEYRVAALPLHAWLGMSTYIMAMLTICTGITQYTVFSAQRLGWTSSAMHLLNSLGIILYSTLFITLYAVAPRRDPAYELQELEAKKESESMGGGRSGDITASGTDYGTTRSSYSSVYERPTLGTTHQSRSPRVV